MPRASCLDRQCWSPAPPLTPATVVAQGLFSAETSRMEQVPLQPLSCLACGLETLWGRFPIRSKSPQLAFLLIVVPHTGASEDFHGPVKLAILGDRTNYATNMPREIREVNSMYYSFWRNFRPNPLWHSIGGYDTELAGNLFLLETDIMSSYCCSPRLPSDQVKALRLTMRDFLNISSAPNR